MNDETVLRKYICGRVSSGVRRRPLQNGEMGGGGVTVGVLVFEALRVIDRVREGVSVVVGVDVRVRVNVIERVAV